MEHANEINCVVKLWNLCDMCPVKCATNYYFIISLNYSILNKRKIIGFWQGLLETTWKQARNDHEMEQLY